MAKVTSLRPRLRFQGNVPGYSSNTVFYVKGIKPSLDLEGYSRVVVATKRGGEKILRLPNSMKITILPKGTGAKTARKTPVTESPKCTCKNHMGTKKILHASAPAALKAIMRRHLHYGGHRIYECPSVRGRYHVTSKS